MQDLMARGFQRYYSIIGGIFFIILCFEDLKEISKFFGLIPAVLRFRIRMDPHSFWSAGSGSGLGIRIRIGSMRAKITHKSEENSSFEVPDVQIAYPDPQK
jgi:hypothetical protein